MNIFILQISRQIVKKEKKRERKETNLLAIDKTDLCLFHENRGGK